jgi:dTDP-4-dehydrorhamnose 3,5-epimerase
MNITELSLPGVLLVAPVVYEDSRGFFVERFRQSLFQQLGLPDQFVQTNHSHSSPRVLRGLHYQHTPPQGKLLTVISGSILDVIVDLRLDSATFGQYLSLELSDQNKAMIWVPPGLAHGFCVIGDKPADVLYQVDAQYNQAGESGIRWNDPDLAIKWPYANPLLSLRDQKLPHFAEYAASLLREQ